MAFAGILIIGASLPEKFNTHDNIFTGWVKREALIMLFFILLLRLSALKILPSFTLNRKEHSKKDKSISDERWWHENLNGQNGLVASRHETDKTAAMQIGLAPSQANNAITSWKNRVCPVCITREGIVMTMRWSYLVTEGGAGLDIVND